MKKELTKERVAKWLERRFFLRIHMSLILIATFLAGLGATKALLLAGVTSLALRYVLAVGAAYLGFLLLIKLWMFYVRVDRGGVDFTGDGIETAFSTSHPELDTGGGSFGGGGATGSWGSAPAKSSSSSGFKLDLGFDSDELLVVVLFIALVLAIFAVGIWIIYTAPALLSEAAFEALLAGALVRRAKKMERRGWIGAVWRATVWPFLLIVVLSGALGWAAKRYCPEATRLRDVWECPSRHRIAG